MLGLQLKPVLRSSCPPCAVLQLLAIGCVVTITFARRRPPPPRSRSYFAQAATDANLAIKQLRYFARFIIICLLLNRREEVWQLLQEFQALISSYIMKYSPPDAAEWRSVIAEVGRGAVPHCRAVRGGRAAAPAHHRAASPLPATWLSMALKGANPQHNHTRTNN